MFAPLELVQDHPVLSNLVFRWQYYHSDHPLRFVRTAQTPVHAIRLSFSCGHQPLSVLHFHFVQASVVHQLRPQPDYLPPSLARVLRSAFLLAHAVHSKSDIITAVISGDLNGKRSCCLRCQPAWFPECLRISVLPSFRSLNDERMLSDIRK